MTSAPTHVRFEYSMTMPDYQARPEISCSDLKRIGEDPAAWKWDKEHPTPPTEEQIFGSAVHGYVLEPDNPQNGIVETDFPDWKTADARAVKAQALEAGGYPLRAQDVAKAKTIAAAVRSHHRVEQIMTDGEPEVSFFGMEGFTALRGRVDWINPRLRTILDVKSARSVNPTDFARAAYDHGYHMSAQHYRAYVAARHDDPPDAWTFVWAAVSKRPPYEVVDFEPMDSMFDLGALQKDRALWRYRHCLETGHWGFGQHTQMIEPPMWAMRQEGML